MRIKTNYTTFCNLRNIVKIEKKNIYSSLLAKIIPKVPFLSNRLDLQHFCFFFLRVRKYKKKTSFRELHKVPFFV